jgi:hypothetical protein
VEPRDLERDDHLALATCPEFVPGGAGWSFEGGNAVAVTSLSGSAAGVIAAISIALDRAREARAKVSCDDRAKSTKEAGPVAVTMPRDRASTALGSARK